MIELKVILEEWEAFALSAFCRRSVFEHFYACSNNMDNPNEVYHMISAISTLRRALAEADIYG